VTVEGPRVAHSARAVRRPGCKSFPQSSVSGAKGSDERPAFDALCKDAARRQFEHGHGLVGQHGDRCRDPEGAEEGRRRDLQDRGEAWGRNRNRAADQGGDVDVNIGLSGLHALDELREAGELLGHKLLGDLVLEFQCLFVEFGGRLADEDLWRSE
jgi:hypothetical protein